MREPYWTDGRISIYHGDAAEILPELEDQSVDLVLTDPPYSAKTHQAVNRSASVLGIGTELGFESMTNAELYGTFAELGRITRRWIIATLDMTTAAEFLLDPPIGLRTLRLGAWLKLTSMPQLSGDRPALGWEPIAYMHRADERARWNGGGRAGNYVLNAVTADRTGHPTPKPLSMYADFARLFSDPGDLILDPFAGSGTSLRAAKDEGRRAIGIELNERWCEVAARRLGQDVLDLGGL